MFLKLACLHVILSCITTDRDKHLCSMKCAQVGCLAFYVDEATKVCKLGTINDGSKRSNSGINAYMKMDNKGNPITGRGGNG